MERICWESRYYHSLEQCQVGQEEERTAIRSTIRGQEPGRQWRLHYELLLTPAWEAASFCVSGGVGGRTLSLTGERSEEGWIVNGILLPHTENCADLDLSLTPLTNTLPVKRLLLEPGQSARIHVLYLDLLEDVTDPRRQCYRKLGPDCYRFETIPKDFTADILFDARGFVYDYPGLFRQVEYKP